MAFATDLSEYKQNLSKQHYLHLKDVLSEDFKSLLRSYGERIRAGTIEEIAEWHIPGKKRQYLFDFPSMAFLDEFLSGICAITDGKAADTIIGERHIKVYLEDAPAYPAPHMDRQAAAFTIGFPIELAPTTEVCFFPHLSRQENTGERAIYADIPVGTDMAAYYRDPRIAHFHGGLGDMIIFHGSTIFHERIRPAGTMILYIKVNNAGRDPLGEHASMIANLKAQPAGAAIMAAE